MIKIKKALEKDLNALNELMYRSKSYWGYEKNFMEKFMHTFALIHDYISKNNTFIAKQDNKIIGFYSFFYNADNQLELDNFFLSPDYIGQGIGKILWEQSVKTASHFKEPYFILWSDPNAEQFYLKMGCQKIGERPSPLMPDRYLPILKYVL